MLDMLLGNFVPICTLLVISSLASNKLLYILLPLILIKNIIGERNIILNLINFACIVLVFFNYVQAINFTDFFSKTYNPKIISIYAIGIIFVINIFLYACKKENIEKINTYMVKYSKIILMVIVAIEAINLIQVFLGKGYIYSQGEASFVGIYKAPHVLSNYMMLIIILNEYLVNIYKNRKIRILHIVPIILIFNSGARTPGICALALLIFFLMGSEYRNKEKSLKYYIIFMIFLIIIFLFKQEIIEMISKSSIIQKFYTTSQYSFSSGRDVFWDILLRNYKNSFNIIEKIFGHGLFYSMYLNFMEYNMSIWGHSDFIDLLISCGLIVTCSYIFFYFRYFWKLYKFSKKWFVLGIFISFVILSAFNGTVNYPYIMIILIYVSHIIYCNNIGGEKGGFLDESAISK